MQKTRLGKTGLQVTRTAFGVLPVQRLNGEDAEILLRKAYEAGINFFDTARGYTDSEEKIGRALSEVRHHIILATKSGAVDRKTLRENLETSLSRLKTDYIDLFQIHNPGSLPNPEDPDGAYQALMDAKKEGLVRHVGLTNHRLDLAMQAVMSGLYETVQFPFSSLSSQNDLALVAACKEHDVGFIAMKALSGGLITHAASAFVFIRQYGNVVPIWGIQRISELEEFIAFEKNPPEMDVAMMAVMEKDRLELAGAFCRGCGYCMPCPVGIPIPLAARMTYLMRRSPYQGFMTAQWREQMERIDSCRHCGQCIRQCPYSLDIPEILKTMLSDYRTFYAEHGPAS